MITGSLQKKKGLYYAVLNLYDDYGKRKPKWIPTGYTIKGNKKKAEEKLMVLHNLYSKIEQKVILVIELYLYLILLPIY